MDYESLFFRALSYMVNDLGVPFEQALDSVGVFDATERAYLRKEFDGEEEDYEEEKGEE